MHYHKKYIEENLGLSFPLAPDKLLESVKDILKPRDKKPKLQSWLYVLLLILVVFGNLNCPTNNTVKQEILTDCLIAYNQLQSESILSEFKAIFWQHGATHNLKKMEDFKDEDFQYFEKEFWEVIKNKRKIVMQMPDGDKLIKEASLIFNHENFTDRFNEFINNHRRGSLSRFSCDMEEYVKNIQDDVLNKVIAHV